MTLSRPSSFSTDSCCNQATLHSRSRLRFMSAIAMWQPLLVRSIVKRKTTSSCNILRVATTRPKIVSAMINFEHLDDLAIGAYDCHRWLIS